MKRTIQIAERRISAAVQLGRQFIGIEKDPGYFDIAKKRIEGVNQ